MPFHQGRRVHPPPDASDTGVDERLSRRKPVRRYVAVPAAYLTDPLRLQPILAIEGKGGRVGQRRGRHALWEMSLHKRRTGDSDVVEAAQSDAVASLNRLRV